LIPPVVLIPGAGDGGREVDGKDRMMGTCTLPWTGAYSCRDAEEVGCGRMQMRRRMWMGVYVQERERVGVGGW